MVSFDDVILNHIVRGVQKKKKNPEALREENN